MSCRHCLPKERHWSYPPATSSRTVQKRVASLQAIGLLTRTERRKTRFGSDTNLYSFEGLIDAALPYAQEKVAEREKRDEAEKDRIARKKPKLQLVKASE